MTDKPHSLRIFISAAEQSADEHAAALIEAFHRLRPEAVFYGLAGPAMQAAGCGVLQDWTPHSAMALAAIRRIPEAYRLLQRIKNCFRTSHFDAAVVIDSPALNLPIAKVCHRFGIPVLYYIAPQTWAWGPKKWRNARIRRRVDHLACIWPFEEPYFQSADIPATFVGHPSFDRLLAADDCQQRVEELRKNARRVITLLPGSRRHVAEEVLPGQLTIAQTLAARFAHTRFYAVAANDTIRAMIEERMARTLHRFNLEILTGAVDRAAAIRAADLVFVASGTVTLEVAYHATPMIVMYNAGRWAYRLLGRWLINTEYLSIPNILAGREIVPEFMPYYPTVDPIIARATEWLSTPKTLKRVRHNLSELIQPMAKPGAAEKTAHLLETMLKEAGP